MPSRISRRSKVTQQGAATSPPCARGNRLRRAALWFGVLLLLLCVPPAYGQKKKIHPDLAHGGLAFGEPTFGRPDWDAIPGPWKARIARGAKELISDAESVRKKAANSLLDDLVELETTVKKYKHAIGRRGEDALKSQRSARHLEQEWLAWIKGGERSWVSTWLTGVALTPARDPARGARALELLVKARHADAETLLLHLGKDESHPHRIAALRAMCHWPQRSLDVFLARGYVQGDPDLGWGELLSHRVKGHGALHEDVGNILLAPLVEELTAEDWLVADAALTIIRGLPKEARMRALIHALEPLEARMKEGKVRWRILEDITTELRNITGRSMGVNPKAWKTFLERYDAGAISLKDNKPEGVSRVEFFGVGKVSDHVTFIIDTSGSMSAPFGTQRHDAYEEAVRQLVGYVERMGEQGWFQVVVFNNSAQTVFPMSRADKKTVVQLGKVMRRRGPGGGTSLGSGVNEGLKSSARHKKKGRDSDTFVVLCDGATIEGHDWAVERLRQSDVPASLRFYCVQIGASAAPAMKALAKLTGGRFIRV